MLLSKCAASGVLRSLEIETPLNKIPLLGSLLF